MRFLRCPRVPVRCIIFEAEESSKWKDESTAVSAKPRVAQAVFHYMVRYPWDKTTAIRSSAGGE
jgi:hypothetical protein